MQKSNAEILNHLYGLLMEINFHRPPDETDERSYQDDPFVQKHLQQIRLRTAKYKALLNKSRYSTVLEEIRRLKEIGFEKIKSLLNPQEALQLQPLFNKFEELSAKDKQSIEEDQELIQLISALKEKLHEQNPDE